jgi:hypothetical protein
LRRVRLVRGLDGGFFGELFIKSSPNPSKIFNEAPRGRDREVSTAGYGNNAAELRGIKPIPNKYINF